MLYSALFKTKFVATRIVKEFGALETSVAKWIGSWSKHKSGLDGLGPYQAANKTKETKIDYLAILRGYNNYSHKA